MTPRTIISIDPGKSGGIAIQHDRSKIILEPMPETEGDIIALLSEHRLMADTEQRERIAVIEEVPTFAGRHLPAHAIAKLYGNYKFIVGALQATHWRIEAIRPQAWQKTFSLGTRAGCKSATVWKNKLKAKAQQLYPDLKITLKTADALLMLEAFVSTHESFAQKLAI